MGSQHEATTALEDLAFEHTTPDGNSDRAIALASLEHTVVLPGSGHGERAPSEPLHRAAPRHPSQPALPPSVSMSVGSTTAPAISFALPPPVSAAECAAACRPRISFQLGLMLSMIAATIVIFTAQHVSFASTPAAARDTAGARTAHTVADEKVGIVGSTREKAKPKPIVWSAMPARAAVTSGPESKAAAPAGPSAAELKESLDALSGAQTTRTF